MPGSPLSCSGVSWEGSWKTNTVVTSVAGEEEGGREAGREREGGREGGRAGGREGGREGGSGRMTHTCIPFPVCMRMRLVCFFFALFILYSTWSARKNSILYRLDKYTVEPLYCGHPSGGKVPCIVQERYLLFSGTYLGRNKVSLI